MGCLNNNLIGEMMILTGEGTNGSIVRELKSQQTPTAQVLNNSVCCTSTISVLSRRSGENSALITWKTLCYFAAPLREANTGNCWYCGSEMNRCCGLDMIQDLSLLSSSLGTADPLHEKAKPVIQPAYYRKCPSREYVMSALNFAMKRPE